MARRLPQLLVHDHRRGDFHVAGLFVDLAPVVEQRVLQDHAVGQEEREARRLVAHHEDVHLAANAAMVALLGLLEVVQVLLKLRLLEEGRAVETLQLLARRVAAPIGTSELHHLEGADLTGGGNMRAGAQIDEGPVAVDRDFLVGQIVDVLELEALVSEELLRLVDAHDLAHERLVCLDDFGHLLLDGAEVVGGDIVRKLEIVEVAVVGCRAEGDLRAGIELLHSFRHDVSAGVAHDMERLGAFRGDDLNGCPIRHGCCEVDQCAVNLASQRSLRKARADGSRNIGDGRAGSELFYRAIG